MRKFAIIASLGLSISCAAAPETKKPRGRLATIQSVMIEDSHISFGVRSTGCTHPADFELKFKPTADGTELSIFRIKQDRCRRMPFVKAIKLPIAKHVDKKTPIFISNPLANVLNNH